MEETIKWIDAKAEVPGSDMNVLIVISDEENKGDAWIGYYTGESWRCSNGGMIGVSHWAEMPTGPVPPA